MPYPIFKPLPYSRLRGPKREYYRRWQESWRKGKVLDVGDNYSYLFEYIQAIFSSAQTNPDLERIESEIKALRKAYPFEDLRINGSFHSYAIEYIADIQIALKRYPEAIRTLSEAYALFIPVRTNKLLSMKLYVGDDVSGTDLLFLYGIPKLTYWGRSNWQFVAQTANEFIETKRKELGKNILSIWVDELKSALGDWEPLLTYCRLFEGAFPDIVETPIRYYYFDLVPKFGLEVDDLARQIENTTREAQGLPKIGEGWISETELYYAIKEALPKLRVDHQAHSKWLGQQHLDIFIPSKKVALEFQGDQHDKPVEFFGGEKAFIETQKRDERKAELCEQNGVRLIYVRSGYSLKSILVQIKKRANT